MDIKKLTDEELVLNLQTLKESSRVVFEQYIEELFERYKIQIYSLSMYYGLQSEDAMDVVQETFIKFLNFHRSFKTDLTFKPWFFKIVLNVVRNKYNELKKHSYVEISKLSSEMFFDENFEKLQKREILRGILYRLPVKEREVILLEIYGGLNLKEISETLGISLRQVYNRLDKAYELLKEYIGDNIDDF
ncbi:MAG: sigma-70 family RNA polymerase sigma factor [Brevinematales bacterium]|nr:sigma-70 family RNA polymerase sigma factor [Brevinematales bacterium]